MSAGSRWCYVCLFVDPYNREIVGCSCGRRKDLSLVKASFSNVGFLFTGIERSVSRLGNPHDNAVVESTNHILKREIVAGRRFGSEEGLRIAPFDWANWYNNFRIHSTLGYMSAVEFREAGLILSQISSRRCCHISHIRGRTASSRAISWHPFASVEHPLDGLPLVFCEPGVGPSDGFLGISAPSRSRAGPSGPTIGGYPPTLIDTRRFDF